VSALHRFVTLYALMYAAFGVSSPFLPAIFQGRGLSDRLRNHLVDEAGTIQAKSYQRHRASAVSGPEDATGAHDFAASPAPLPMRSAAAHRGSFGHQRADCSREATLSGLIAGFISASSMVAPTGFEPVFGHGRVFAKIDCRLPRPVRSEAPHDSNTEGRSRAPDFNAHYLVEEPRGHPQQAFANTRPGRPPSGAALKCCSSPRLSDVLYLPKPMGIFFVDTKS